MSDELNDRPPEGSLVRMKGNPDGQVMWVSCPALGEQHDWEGVRNGILCEWTTDDETHFEVFRPGQLDLVAINSGEHPEFRLTIEDAIATGDASYKLPIDDYLNYLKGSDRERIASLYKTAISAVSWYTKYYQVEWTPPIVVANLSKKLKPYTTTREIIISRWAIDFALSYLPPIETPEEVDLVIDLAPELCIFWMTSHEITHIARGHHLMKQEHQDLEFAYEHDADCMAVAALYRYCSSIISERCSQLPELIAAKICKIPVHDIFRRHAKLAALYIVYWSIRFLPEADGDPAKQTHPRWAARMRYCITKLYDLDLSSLNYGATKMAEEEIKYLMTHLATWEKTFLASQGLPKESSPLHIWLHKLDDKISADTRRANRTGEELQKLLPKYSQLIGDKHRYYLPPSMSANISSVTYSAYFQFQIRAAEPSILSVITDGGYCVISIQ